MVLERCTHGIAYIFVVSGVICGRSLCNHEGTLSQTGVWCYSLQWWVSCLPITPLLSLCAGVTEAVIDDWEYFEIIRTGADSTCMTRLETAIQQIDDIIAQGKHTQALKTLFGLPNITHDIDFASTLSVCRPDVFYSDCGIDN